MTDKSKLVSDFLKSDKAMHCWLLRSDGYYTRGNPNTAPYEVVKGPLLELPPNSRAYWNHYGYGHVAPVLTENELAVGFQDECPAAQS